MGREPLTLPSYYLLFVVLSAAIVGSCAYGSPADADAESGAGEDAERGRRGTPAADRYGEDLGDASTDVQGDAPENPCNDVSCQCTPETEVEDCAGLTCVDGYCCDQPCDGECQACNRPGMAGTCTNHEVNTDPEADCSVQAAGSCGTTGVCDGAGQCAFYGAEISCDDGETCSDNDVCDGAGQCRGEVPPGCAPGEGNECCIATCTDFGGCASVAAGCADECGESTLTIGGTCIGCGLAGAAGTCQGTGTYSCSEADHDPCLMIECDGATYWCTNEDGLWAWRPSATCDDDNLCTYGDRCAAGECEGFTVDCSDGDCADRECNGTDECTVTPKTGTACEDGDLCTYDDTCSAAGVCSSGPTFPCDDAPCIARACTGEGACSETILDGEPCEDGNLCTYGDTCNAGGACDSGSTLSCDGRDTTCLSYRCDGTDTCAAAPNIGDTCDDGDPETDDDVCQSDGSCQGSVGCPPPTVSCTDGTQNRRGCGGARTVGRVRAGASGGVTIIDDTCDARDDFEDSSSCWDANNDHSYRLYLREGESARIRYLTGEPCAYGQSSWSGTLKVFETAGCDATGCGDKVYCDYNERDQTITYVAPQDGWIIIVADGSHASDDEGAYALTVDLTCRDADCECP